MRDMKVAWPRWIGFLILATLCWWGANQLHPDRATLEQVCFRSLGDRVLGDLDDWRAEGDDTLVVNSVVTRWGPDCQVALSTLFGKSVTVSREAQGVLTLECGHVGATADIHLTLSLQKPPDTPGAAPPEPEVKRAKTTIPTGISILPPILAILFALILRRIYVALLAAIYFGALLYEDLAIWPAVERTVDDYLWQPATDSFNLTIFGFTMALIGMVHVTIASGGMQGVIDKLARLARGVRSTQAATALMGLAIFFDDYANSVVVGSSARPLTDSKGISREKLAYLVDSTAAPVAGIAILSTWIGMEIDLFQKQLPYVDHIASSGYDLFFEVLPYRFYCIFALALVFIIALTGRDWGLMLKAEERARAGVPSGRPQRTPTGRVLQETEVKAGIPHRWANAVVPITFVILSTFLAFVIIGADALEAREGRVISWASASDLFDAFIAGGEDNMIVLFWTAMAGSALAMLMALAQRLLTLQELGRVWLKGAMSMLPAIAILILAAGIRKVSEDVETARFLVALLSDVQPWLLPLFTFLLASGVAFATGTSWGTMGIVLPVAVPLAAALTANMGVEGEIITLLVAGSALDGAIFGDHCSLISDTSVMSSMACSCDHVDHVRTQIPYATLAMFTAATFGYVLSGATGGISPWLAYLAGIAFMLLWVRLRGRVAEPRLKD